MEWTRRSMHTERRHRTEWEVPCKAMGLELLRISPPPSLPLLPSTHPCSAYPPPTRPCLPSPPLVSFQGSLDLYPGPACAQQHKSNARLRIQLLMILHFFFFPLAQFLFYCTDHSLFLLILKMQVIIQEQTRPRHNLNDPYSLFTSLYPNPPPPSTCYSPSSTPAPVLRGLSHLGLLFTWHSSCKT